MAALRPGSPRRKITTYGWSTKLAADRQAPDTTALELWTPLPHNACSNSG